MIPANPIFCEGGMQHAHYPNDPYGVIVIRHSIRAGSKPTLLHSRIYAFIPRVICLRRFTNAATEKRKKNPILAIPGIVI